MPDQERVDIWKRNIETAKSNPSVWFDSLSDTKKTDKIANEYVINIIDSFVQYSRTGSKPQSLTERRIYSEVYDVRIPNTFGKMINHSCQVAMFNLVELFRNRVESYAQSKLSGAIDSQTLLRQKQWNIERELVTDVLSSYDSRLFSMHNLYYNDIPNASWKAGRYKELVFTDTARAFYHIMSSDNQYWMLDQTLGCDAPTSSPEKRRFVRRRRQAGADVLIEHLYQQVLIDKSIMKHWFMTVIDEQVRMENVERWRRSMLYKHEVQSELERVIWMVEMNKQLETTLDRMT